MSGVAALGWAAAAVSGVVAVALQARLVRHAALVADAGHELRGPLCAARLGLYFVEDDARAAAIELELRRAALALDDLTAACDGRRAGERAQLVDVGALLDDAAEAWGPLARAFGAELAVEPLRGRALVRADPVRLTQACGNLVANAVEHGASPVRVRGRVLAGRVRVEVQDAGPGLPVPVGELIGGAGRRTRLAELLRRPAGPPLDDRLRSPARGPLDDRLRLPARGPLDDLLRLPARFPRSLRMASVGRAASPRGRGLAIAAGIAERHGGRLAAAPSADGACLVLELPCADGSPAPRP